MIGLVSVTRAGHAAAERLEQAWNPDPGTRRYDGPAAEALPRAFNECDAVVNFLAVGATVRLIAPLLTSKHDDPAVVCVDEALRFAVPVLGAHQGGGNELARRAPPPWAPNPSSPPPATRPGARAWTSSAPTWASPSSRAATWPPSAPRSCPATGSRSAATRNGRCPRCRPTWCARTGRNRAFRPSW